MTTFERSQTQDQIDDARMAANAMTGSQQNRTQIMLALAKFELVLATLPVTQPNIVVDDDGE